MSRTDRRPCSPWRCVSSRPPARSGGWP
jgi:hypothetical protein